MQTKTVSQNNGVERRIDRSATTPRIEMMGVRFDNLDMDGTLDRIEQLIEKSTPALVVTPNVDHVLRAHSDSIFADLLRHADMVLADGQPLVWASRLLGKPLRQRVAGSDLFPLLCGRAAEKGYRVFFMGGDPGAAEAAADVLRARYPNLIVAGTNCPPYGFEKDAAEDRRTVEAVKAARPDILFVGLGSPKQELWIARHLQEMAVPVSIGVGISFSFIAGQVKRAPRWMRRASLEWLHRLCCEPRRLWKRYLIRGPKFAPLVLREWIQSRR